MDADYKDGEQGQKSKRLKLLIASDNFLPRWDGISRFLAELIPRLQSFDITVLAPDYGYTPIEKSAHFRLVKVPLSRLKIGDFKVAKPSAKMVRQEVRKCDIVFSQTIGPVGLAAINAAKKEGKRVASYIHSVEWELFAMALGMDYLKRPSFAISKGFIRRVYSKVDLLIFPSHSIEELFTWHQVGRSKEVIHLGVDTRKFCQPESKAEAKKRLVLDQEAFIIGYHGRIAREKDLPTLLRAYIIVKKQNPKAVLLVIGDGLESIKKKLAGVKGAVLQGSTDNVTPYIQAMDVFCLTSLTETTSLTTLEAMACAVPVVVNKVGFVKEYISEGKTGLFFRAKDSYDLSKKLIALLKDEGLRKRLGANARKFVEKEFDWALTAKKLDETLQTLAHSR